MAKKKDKLIEDSKDKLPELREKLRLIKFKAQGAKSKNVKEASTLKKQIARILTEINKKK